ncbi:MAG: hypothetical protein AB1782_15950 [Cyanobacteriota bacterium]
MELLVKDLVFIKEKVALVDAVQLSFFFEKKEQNELLVESYVHGSDKITNNKDQRPIISSLSMIKSVIRSNDNKYVVISDYGCGKSHLGLMLANFFAYSHNDQILQTFFESVREFSGESFLSFLETYKQNNLPKLPILLSGEKFVTDLRGELYKAIVQSLEWYKDCVDSTFEIKIPGPTKNALNWVNSLGEEESKTVNSFLNTTYNIDLPLLKNELEQSNYEKLDVTKECFKHLHNILPDFGDQNIEDQLSELIELYCVGENPKFSGILIVFDELGAFIERYQDDPKILYYQNLTNALELSNNKNKIHLIQFIQQSPNIRFSHLAKDHPIKKITERMGKEVYLLTTLENLVDRILVQENLATGEVNTHWVEFSKKAFIKKKLDKLSEITLNLYLTGNSNYTWNLELINKVITYGCYPLHPMSVYLLCNSFTPIYQGSRSLLNFIKNKFKNYLNKEAIDPVTKEPYIYYPVDLVKDLLSDYLDENTDYGSVFKQYKFALQELNFTADCKSEKQSIVRAIFLLKTFFSQWNEISYFKNVFIALEWLTGIPLDQLKTICQKLEDSKIIIQREQSYDFRDKHISQGLEDELNKEFIKNYKLYHSSVIKTLEQTLSKRIVSKIDLKLFLNKYSQKSRETMWLPNNINIIPEHNILKHSLENYIKNTDVNSSVVLIYRTNLSTKDIELKVKNLLKELQESSYKIVIGIPEYDAKNLTDLIIKNKILREKEKAYSSKFKDEYYLMKEELNTKINEQIKNWFSSINYYVHETIENKLSNDEQKDLSKVIEKVYLETYPKVAPYKTDKFEKQNYMYTKYFIPKLVSGKITDEDLHEKTKAFISFKNDLFLEGDNASWQVINRSGKITEPKNANVKEAYKIIDSEYTISNTKEIFLRDKLETLKKTLYSKPYAYDDYAFFLLLSVWLGSKSDQIEVRNINNQIVDLTKEPTNKNSFIQDWDNKLRSLKIVQKEKVDHDIYLKSLEDCDQYELAKDLISKYDMILSNSGNISQKILDKICKKYKELNAEVQAIDDYDTRFEYIQNESNKIELTILLNELKKLVDLKPPILSIINNYDISDEKNILEREIIKKIKKYINEEIAKLSNLASFSQKETCYHKLLNIKNTISKNDILYDRLSLEENLIDESLKDYLREKQEEKVYIDIISPIKEIIENNKPIIKAEEVLNKDFSQYKTDKYNIEEELAKLKDYIESKYNQKYDLENLYKNLQTEGDLMELKEKAKEFSRQFALSSYREETQNFVDKVEGIHLLFVEHKGLITNSFDVKDLNKKWDTLQQNSKLNILINIFSSLKDSRLEEFKTKIGEQASFLLAKVNQELQGNFLDPGLKRSLNKINKEISDFSDLKEEFSHKISEALYKIDEFESNNKEQSIRESFKGLSKEKQKKLLEELQKIVFAEI